MNDKHDPTLTTEATETTPRQPLVLRRQVVRVMQVRTGIQTGRERICCMMSKPGP